MRIETFKDWQRFAAMVENRATRLQSARHDEGWKLAASVGIPHDMCCLHNASIDTELKGWCFENPERLKAARRANHIVNDWSISEKARKIVNRAWNKMAAKNGFCQSQDV